MQEGLSPMLIDTGDFTHLEFWMPESLRMGVVMDVESHPNATRTGAVRWWKMSQLRLDLELVFLAQEPGPNLRTRAAIEWLHDRCGPRTLGDMIVGPPPTFLLVNAGPLIPSNSQWEIEEGFDLNTEGLFSFDNGMIPPKVTVRLGLVRVDTFWRQ